MRSGNKEVRHKIEFFSAVKNPLPSKYQDCLGQKPGFIEESEMYKVDKEIKTEEEIDPLSIIIYDDSETKIEIDLVMKTESSDISEFIDQ